MTIQMAAKVIAAPTLSHQGQGDAGSTEPSEDKGSVEDADCWVGCCAMPELGRPDTLLSQLLY